MSDTCDWSLLDLGQGPISLIVNHLIGNGTVAEFPWDYCVLSHELPEFVEPSAGVRAFAALSATCRLMRDICYSKLELLGALDGLNGENCLSRGINYANCPNWVAPLKKGGCFPSEKIRGLRPSELDDVEVEIVSCFRQGGAKWMSGLDFEKDVSVLLRNPNIYQYYLIALPEMRAWAPNISIPSHREALLSLVKSFDAVNIFDAMPLLTMPRLVRALVTLLEDKTVRAFVCKFASWIPLRNIIEGLSEREVIDGLKPTRKVLHSIPRGLRWPDKLHLLSNYWGETIESVCVILEQLLADPTFILHYTFEEMATFLVAAAAADYIKPVSQLLNLLAEKLSAGRPTYWSGAFQKVFSMRDIVRSETVYLSHKLATITPRAHDKQSVDAIWCSIITIMEKPWRAMVWPTHLRTLLKTILDRSCLMDADTTENFLVWVLTIEGRQKLCSASVSGMYDLREIPFAADTYDNLGIHEKTFPNRW